MPGILHTPEALTTKQEIRAKMRRLNRSQSPEARAVASAKIIADAEKHPIFKQAKTVALFCSLPDEPDTSKALFRWSRTKRIVLPRIEGDKMTFRQCDPMTLQPGAFGIWEPSADSPICPPDQIDLILVPGMAFAHSGLRLGRGKGYYDKYMSQPGFRAVRLGVCYAHQLVERLPCEPHDLPVDGLLQG